MATSEFAGLHGYTEACDVVSKNLTPRAIRLQKLDDYVQGTQYSTLASWWSDKPLWERAPCIVDPIVKTSIASNVSLVLGEGRYPSATSRPDEDEPEEALDKEASAQLDKLLEQIEDVARYPAHCRDALEQAQGTGTAVALLGARKGRPFAELVKAQWCTRDVDQDGNVTKLVIQYPYLDVDRVDSKKVAAYLFRREIDAYRDVTYKPARLNKDGLVEGMTPSVEVAHDLGFCPVVWYRFMAGCGVVTQIDGHAVHENILGQLDSLNYAFSQKQHAAIYCGEPQPYEIGVTPGYCPTAPARIGRIPAAPGAPTNANAATTGYEVGGSAGHAEGRKKGPGYVWQYEDKDTKVGYLTVPEGALKALEEHCRDSRSKIAESLFFVGLDPEQVKFAATVSGKAMEALRARQLDWCDQIRDDFGSGYLLPGIDMLLRIVYTLTKRGRPVYVPSLKRTLKILDQFAAAVA